MEKQIITFSANEQILKKTAGQDRFADDVVGYIEAHFDLGDNWTGYDSIRAVWFTAFAQISAVLDQNGVCLVPPEVCNRKEAVNVNLVGSIADGDELTDRLTTYPIVAFIFDGNARVDGTETAPVTPSQFEQYVAIVEALVGSVKDIDHATLNADYTLTIYYSDGTSDTVGPIRGEQGPTGPTGNGIASIAKTGTSGTNPVVDTYTITYTNGQTTTFTVTNGVKGDTGNGIESIYLTGTSGAVKTYTILMTDGSTFEFEVTDGEVTQAVLDQTVEDIEADIYESTIVQVKSDTDPYFFRKTNNGNGCGRTCHDEIVGASVGWNQLMPGNGFISGENLGITASLNSTTGLITLSGQATTTYRALWQRGTLIVGHVYLNTLKFVTNPNNISLRPSFFNGVCSYAQNVNGDMIGRCISERSTVNAGIDNFGGADTNFDGTTLYTNTFDLTAMLGSTIADYIYTLEQGTAGAGVSFFKRYFGDDYYPFDSGSIRSVEGLVSHDMVGFNQLEEQPVIGARWNTNGTYSSSGNNDYAASPSRVKCFPNTSYCISFPNTSVNLYAYFMWFDADGNFIGGSSATTVSSTQKKATFTTSSDAHYLALYIYRSGWSSASDIKDTCINISDADLNGQYKPYEKHSYPLDNSATLRGRFVLDNGKLKAEGDVYKSSGEITRNWGEVDMSTLGLLQSSGFYYRMNSQGLNMKANESIPFISFDTNIVSIYYNSNNGQLRIYVSDDSQAPSGKLVYPLATPTTETATPYAKTQKVDPSGTEEYVSTGVVPIGHNTEYPMTLIDTMPKANGSYTMHLTVANGKRVVSWS